MSEPAVKAPFLQRVGLQYFHRRSQRVKKVEAIDAVHFLNADERKALKRVEYGAISRAALAGAVSATIAAAAELIATPMVPEGSAAFGSGNVKFWLIVGGTTLVASVLEIAFVYWDTLNSVHELARVAGLELFGKDRAENDRMLAEALARAALELPNPVQSRGINAHRESSKLRMLAASFAYKAKIGVTNFLIKMVIRRILGRVLVRSALAAVLPFVSVPVTAAWNGVVSWLTLREARVRAMGPSAVSELLDVVLSDAAAMSPPGKLAAVRAVAAAIVRTQDLHPNLMSLLDQVNTRMGDVGAAELDDVGLFLESLKALPAHEARLAVQLVAIACIVDGRLTTREKSLAQDALAACGRSVDLTAFEHLRTQFVAGNGFVDDAIRGL